ncbi:MAG: hypothetical protein ACERKD_23470 [Prolixibacteraceae bacterium]
MYEKQIFLIDVAATKEKWLKIGAAKILQSTKDAPPYLVSLTNEPNFSVGDVSGMITGKTTNSYPFFFHVEIKLFTMTWDLYRSELRFTGESNPAEGIGFDELENKSISVFPNPAKLSIQIVGRNILKAFKL